MSDQHHETISCLSAKIARGETLSDGESRRLADARAAIMDRPDIREAEAAMWEALRLESEAVAELCRETLRDIADKLNAAGDHETAARIRAEIQGPRNIGAIITLVLADAYMRRDDAAQSGAHHDGGASQTEREVRMYQHGLAGTLPPEWQKFADDVNRAADPEWAEYQRLARKFGAT